MKICASFLSFCIPINLLIFLFTYFSFVSLLFSLFLYFNIVTSYGYFFVFIFSSHLKFNFDLSLLFFTCFLSLYSIIQSYVIFLISSLTSSIFLFFHEFHNFYFSFSDGTCTINPLLPGEFIILAILIFNSF